MDEIAAILAILAAMSFALAATLWQKATVAAGIARMAAISSMRG